MARKFQELAQTDAVKRAQEHYYGKSQQIRTGPESDAFTPDEVGFIQARDSFYMATVSETGWPYLQHRGGPIGFLRVRSPSCLAFADYKGNRQLLSTGNLSKSDRVTLFLMDYPHRTRLKIMGHARIEDAREYPELVTELAEPEVRASVERLFFIDVVSFDWNCPQHITPRYTAAEIEDILAPNRKPEGIMNPRPPLPPFDQTSALQKVRLAEDGWNSRDAEKVVLAYTVDSVWRNRAEFLSGRAAIVDFLTRKWRRELEYRLIKELWAFTGNRIAVRFAYEWHDDSGQWFRSYGNENWEFDPDGFMHHRHASINDLPIHEAERKFFWPQGRQPDEHPGLTALGL